MSELFSLIPHVGVLICIACMLLAGAVFFYVPDPLKHPLMDVLFVAGLSVFLWGDGYSAAEVVDKAKFETAMSQINDANEKAVLDAEAKVRAATNADIATLKAQLEAQDVQVRSDTAEYQRVLQEITAAGADADQPAPGVILDAIQEKSK